MHPSPSERKVAVTADDSQYVQSLRLLRVEGTEWNEGADDASEDDGWV